ncbi:hypothetical protein QBC39DRAFT_363398 [Podospora conica]|nr:hypothetical protein QBC39DRAFT_363398 [Schizothecium conicum]
MSDQAAPISSLKSLQLDLPPSCVEFCPAFPSYFVVGTYNLQKDEDASGTEGENDTGPKTQNRNGSLVVFRVDGQELVQLQVLPQPSALLDLRFSPHPGQQHICVAVSSTATISMFSLSGNDDDPLEETGTATMSMLTKGARESESGLLFLAFAWHPSRKDTIAVSTSEGGIHLVHLGGSSNDWAMSVNPVLTHSLEAWCVTIHAPLDIQEESRPFMVFSGGDDSNLFYTTCTDTDLTERDADEDEDEPRTTHRIRGHEAGVTAILPLDSNLDPDLQLVVTGSYDDHIRLFGVGHAGIGGSRLLAERHLGGGVWRLKVVKVDRVGGAGWRMTILASCMHAGVRIVELSKSVEGVYGFRTLASFVEHQSMNYGSDFQPGSEEDLVVVSTSFYDKLLCLWRFSNHGGKDGI